MSISEHFFFSPWEGVVSASPNPRAGGPPLVGCPRLLLQFIRTYPPYRRPFLHPQPEDAPCLGDRDPQTRSAFTHNSEFSNSDFWYSFGFIDNTVI